MNFSLKHYSIAFVLGAVLTLAFAPFFIFQAIFISLSGLLILAHNSLSTKHSFWLGWAFGFGHFTTSLYWLANPLMVDAKQFAWLIPFAVTLIPALLACYSGLAIAVWHKLPQNTLIRWLCFPVIWLVTEVLRATLFTGFPWNLLGYSWMFADSMFQTADIWYVYGLSFWAALVGTVFYFLYVNKRAVGRIASALAVIAVMASFYAYGSHKLDQPISKQAELSVEIIQANIPKQAYVNRQILFDVIAKHLKLTNRFNHNAKLIIWPESGFALPIEHDEQLRKYIAKHIPEGSYLIGGGIRLNDDKYWNSLFVLDDKGNVVNYYDKRHLVPFGEYVPLGSYFPWIKKITHGAVDFTAGIKSPYIAVDNIGTFIAMICYEAIFSNPFAKEKEADFIINITEDAWFGDTIGPQQHFAMARMRAVELGLPMIRNSNTGISAVINQNGVIRLLLPYDVRGNIHHPSLI